MAWSTPLTAVANNPLTAAQWNASVRDNLLETSPAKATAAGRIFVSTGANAIAERVPSSAVVAAGQTTTSGPFVDLATVGPAVTVTTGTAAFVAFSLALSNSSATENSIAAVAVTGASSIAADDANGIIWRSHTAAASGRFSIAYLLTGLTAGSNTFTLKYHVSGGTGTFGSRQLAVIPL